MIDLSESSGLLKNVTVEIMRFHKTKLGNELKSVIDAQLIV